MRSLARLTRSHCPNNCGLSISSIGSIARCSSVLRAQGIEGRPRGPSVPQAVMAQRYSKAYRSKEGAPSVARVYPDVCEKAPAEYSAYEQLKISWGDQDNYEASKRGAWCRPTGFRKPS